MDDARINEIVNFLRANAQDKLTQLQKRFPDQSNIFVVDQLGVSDPALRLRCETALLAMTELQPRAVGLLAVAIAQNRAAERSEDASTAVTAIGALVTALLAIWKQLDPAMLSLPAGLTFASSLWSLQAKRRRRALFAGDVQAHARTLADAAEKAKEIASDLRTYVIEVRDIDYSQQVVPLIERANAIAGDVNKAQMDLGQFPKDALN